MVHLQSASLSGEVPPQVVLLSAYIELMSGRCSVEQVYMLVNY